MDVDLRGSPRRTAHCLRRTGEVTTPAYVVSVQSRSMMRARVAGYVRVLFLFKRLNIDGFSRIWGRGLQRVLVRIRGSLCSGVDLIGFVGEPCGYPCVLWSASRPLE